MFMILEHHFVVHNGFKASEVPIGFERFFLIVFMSDVGKIGVVVFFTISSWFLIDKEITFRSSLKRLWILEKEVLYYSLILGIAYYSIHLIGAKTFAKSLLPLTTNTWWYVSSYALFLLLLPFIASGLHSLGREKHLLLAGISFILLGILKYVPGYPASDDSYATFVLLFVIISAYKMYILPMNMMQSAICIAIGASFMILRFAFFEVIYVLAGLNKPDALSHGYVFPVLMVGFGLFSLCNAISFHSAVINRIAKSSFAVYLITDYAASEKLLWGQIFNLRYFYQDSFAIVKILAILLAIYCVCTIVDFLRQFIFSVTIGRNPGRWFDMLTEKFTSYRFYLSARKLIISVQQW